MSKLILIGFLVLVLVACTSKQEKAESINAYEIKENLEQTSKSKEPYKSEGDLTEVTDASLKIKIQEGIDSLFKQGFVKQDIIEYYQDTSYRITSNKLYVAEHSWYPFLIEGEAMPSLGSFYLHGVFKNGKLVDYFLYIDEDEKKVIMESYITTKRLIKIYGKEISLIGLDTNESIQSQKIYSYNY